MAPSEAVANEPRLFVGQLSAKCTEDDLWPFFSRFGTIRNLHILRGPDSKRRGCAMVLFSKWSEAEAAAESLVGTTTLSNGQGRPLVLHFANPRKLPAGQPPSGGLAPKKLFVGQVPRDVTEDMLHSYFEPYGEIEHINILRTQHGQSAGCGFVQFRKWSQAESALEAHNGKTRLAGSEVPLVVKFAYAKRKDQALQHLGLGLRDAAWTHDLKHMDTAAAEFAAYQLGAHKWANQRLLRGNTMLGGNVVGNQLALMQNLMPQQGYQGRYGHQAPYLQSHHIPQPDRNVFSGLNDRIQEAEFANQLINQAAGLGDINSLSKQPEVAEENPTCSTAELAQQLGQLQLAVIDQQHQEQAPSFQDKNPNGQFGYPGSNQRLPHPLAQGCQGYPRHPLVPQDGLHYNQQPLNLARGPMGLQAMGRPWGQKIGSNDKYNKWKLFVGQLPLEATEETIWELFSPVGPILELYILRNKYNGKSRGCAFVTYQTKGLAKRAITALDGCLMTSGKILVVKFADSSSANKAAVAAPTQQQAGLLDISIT